MKGFILTLSLALAFFASADDHMEPSTSEGAFTTFHVTADDLSLIHISEPTRPL